MHYLKLCCVILTTTWIAISSAVAKSVNYLTVAGCPNISVFQVKSVDFEVGEKLALKAELALIRNIRGKEHDTLFLSVTGEKASMKPFARPPRNSLWITSPIKSGETIAVGYVTAIEQPQFIIVGDRYVDDVLFITSIATTLSFDEKRTGIDAFLKANDHVIHESVASYVGEFVNQSGWNEDSWRSYVQGNPMGLSGAAYVALFEVLECMMFNSGTADETAKAKEERNLGLRTNVWIAEFASQLPAVEFADLSIKSGAVRLLAKRFQSFKPRLSGATLEVISQLLHSGKLSDSEKALFD